MGDKGGNYCVKGLDVFDVPIYTKRQFVLSLIGCRRQRSPSHLRHLQIRALVSIKARDSKQVSFSASSPTIASQPDAEMSSTIRQVSEANSSQAAGQPEQPRVYVSQQQPGSSPDLTTTNVNTYQTGRVMEDGRGSRRQWGPTQAPEDSPLDGDTVSSLSRKNKPRPFAHLLGRSRSTRNDLGGPLTPKTSLPNRFAEPDNAAPNDAYEDTYGMRTAPMGQERDRSFREMMSSTIRNRSADRQAVADSESGSIGSGKEFSSSRSNLGNSTSSGAFLTNLKNTSTKAADGIGKAGKGILGKITRSYSSGEKDGTPDENYVCKVITMNLVDQTRITRISKRLEDSKDKTEFWMPALPWRCIE